MTFLKFPSIFPYFFEASVAQTTIFLPTHSGGHSGTHNSVSGVQTRTSPANASFSIPGVQSRTSPTNASFSIQTPLDASAFSASCSDFPVPARPSDLQPLKHPQVRPNGSPAETEYSCYMQEGLLHTLPGLTKSGKSWSALAARLCKAV